MPKNKKEIIILMIVGYVIFMLGYTSFSIMGIAISFIGGMLVLIPLFYLAIKNLQKKSSVYSLNYYFNDRNYINDYQFYSCY